MINEYIYISTYFFKYIKMTIETQKFEELCRKVGINTVNNSVYVSQVELFELYKEIKKYVENQHKPEIKHVESVDTSTKKKLTTKEKIYSQLNTKSMTADELSSLLELEISTVRKQLTKLHDKGFVYCDKTMKPFVWSIK